MEDTVTIKLELDKGEFVTSVEEAKESLDLVTRKDVQRMIAEAIRESERLLPQRMATLRARRL